MKVTIQDFYRAAVEVGIESDPRGKDAVLKSLRREKENFDKLTADEKKFYDREKLHNPYADTRILFANDKELSRGIEKILVGIDIEAPEIILADNLMRKNDNRFDCPDAVLGHHPEGTAYARFYEVMKMQSDIFNRYGGVPINIAEDLTIERLQEVSRRVAPANHQRASDAARILKVPFLCVHTPADNCVTSYLISLMDKEKPETVGDVVKLLRDIPEYEKASYEGAGPFILVGEKSRKAGKIFVDMTGGTEGSKNIFDSLSLSGKVGTIIAMHLSDEHYKKAKENHINVVVAGHIASDTLGLNLLLDKVNKRLGKNIETIDCSGFRRVKRNLTRKDVKKKVQ